MKTLFNERFSQIKQHVSLSIQQDVRTLGATTHPVKWKPPFLCHQSHCYCCYRINVSAHHNDKM